MKYTNLDCIYRKVGGRYVPIGACEPVDRIPDGIWYVRTKKSSRGITSGEYIGEMLKIGDSDDISINVQCGIVDIAEEVLDSQEMRDLLNDKNGYSVANIVNLTTKIIYDKFKK